MAAFKRDYGLWLGASTSDMLGRSLCTVALPFVIVELTGSTAVAGVVNTAGTIAFLLVMLFGGVLVDRIDRRKGMYARSISGALLWLAFALLLFFDVLQLWHVVAITVSIKILDGLFGMADNAALRSIVPGDEEFTKAVSINQGRNAAVNIGGGPIGGFLYSVAHSLPYFVSAAFLAVMAVLTRLIRTDLRPSKDSEARLHDGNEGKASGAIAKQHGVGAAIRKVFRDIGEGFAFVWKEPVLRANCLIFMAVNAGFAFTVNTTMYHLMLRGYTAFELSIMESVFAVLMIVASILAGRYLPRFRSGRVLLVAFSGMLAVSILATVSHGYVQLLVWLALYGLMLPFIASTTQGYMFSTTPGHLQGRVNSVAGIAELGITAFVPAITGALVGAGYVVLSFSLGVAVAALSVAGVLASRGLRTLGKPSEWHPYPAEDDD